MLFKLTFSFLLLCGCSFIVNAQSAADCIIERSYPCEDVPNQKVNFTITPKTFTYPEVLDMTLVTPISLGNQLRLSISVDRETKIGLKTWERLVKLEDDFCRANQMYAGAFLYELETALGVQPRGVCPIPKGNYHAVNYTADYSLMKAQMFPLGKLRTTVKYVEKSTKDIMVCVVIISSSIHRS